MKLAPKKKKFHFLLDLSDHANKVFIKTGKETCVIFINTMEFLG